MAGASYLFFLTVLFFFRGTIAVKLSPNVANKFENCRLSKSTKRVRNIKILNGVLEFRLGVLFERHWVKEPVKVLDFRFLPSKDVQGDHFLLSFTHNNNTFRILNSGEITEYTDKEVDGFIVEGKVSSDGDNSEIAYNVTLINAGDDVQDITGVVSEHVYNTKYLIKDIFVLMFGGGHLFFDDSNESVVPPSDTNPSAREPMSPPEIIKLRRGNGTKLTVRAFPQFSNSSYAVLHMQFYSNTEKVVGDISFFKLTLTLFQLTIVGSSGHTTLALKETTPEGIVVQMSLSSGTIKYVVNVYKRGECIGTSTGEMNGGGNRIIIKSENFIRRHSFDISTLPELQSSIPTVLAFNAMGLSRKPDFRRYIIFDGQFSLGYIVVKIPGMACSSSIWLEVGRSVDIEYFTAKSKNLSITFAGTRLFANPGVYNKNNPGVYNKNNPELDTTGMNVDGFTVELKMYNNEIRYEVTPYSGGKSFNGKRLHGVLWGITTTDYNRLLVTMMDAGTVFYPLGIQYGENIEDGTK